MKTFISNLVAEILRYSSPGDWHHCPGKLNPADIITRGVLAEALIESEYWLSGPEWLNNFYEYADIKVEFPLKDHNSHLEECKNDHIICALVGNHSKVYSKCHYSSSIFVDRAMHQRSL